MSMTDMFLQTFNPMNSQNTIDSSTILPYNNEHD